MHEESLIRTLLKQVGDLGADHPDHRLCRINVSVGEFSGVDPELLQLAFGRLTDGAPLEGVEFCVERVPLTARCRDCCHEFPVERFRFVCPHCGGLATDVLRGDELILESVSFEEQQT